MTPRARGARRPSRSSPPRFVRPSVLALTLLGISLILAGCGASGPSKSYQQGWDRAVTSPGLDCKIVPRRIASDSEWTMGCRTEQGWESAHVTTGHNPTPTPTTYAGDP
jgi:hypothetical protein